jgi:hypothetical protein
LTEDTLLCFGRDVDGAGVDCGVCCGLERCRRLNDGKGCLDKMHLVVEFVRLGHSVGKDSLARVRQGLAVWRSEADVDRTLGEFVIGHPEKSRGTSF